MTQRARLASVALECRRPVLPINVEFFQKFEHQKFANLRPRSVFVDSSPQYSMLVFSHLGLFRWVLVGLYRVSTLSF